MAIDCLVIGHFDSPIEELASRLRPNRSHSGAYSEIRTNSVQVNGKQLSYSELFGELSLASWGIKSKLNPFRAPHSGAIFLANRLRREGLTAEVVSFVSNSGHELINALEEWEPRVVAITTTFYVEPSGILQLISHIRSVDQGTLIVLGGPFVSSRTANMSQSVASELKTLGADALIVDAQGELALVELVRRVSTASGDLGDIPNLIFWEPQSGQPVAGRRIRESNSLPENRIHWDEFSSELSPRLAFLRTARGCSFRCAFCNYPAMAGQYDLSEISSVCEELEQLASLGVRHVAFVDDTFNVPLPRFKALMKEIIRRDLGLRWTSFFRCSNADIEVFDLMAAAGCEAVFLGIESGDPEILKAMNKAARIESYIRGIRALRERNIMMMASYIIGFPGETTESIQRTLEFIMENPTDFYNVQLYYHDRMAPIEAQRDKYKISGAAYMWEHKSMDWQEAADWVEYAMLKENRSTPLPLYGFSIWSLPYFRALGFSQESFKGFTRIAAQAFRQGLAGEVNLAAYTEPFTKTITLQQLRESGLESEPPEAAGTQPKIILK